VAEYDSYRKAFNDKFTLKWNIWKRQRNYYCGKNYI